MRVLINGKLQNVPVVGLKGSVVSMIDQRLLPFKFHIQTFQDCQATVQAIKDLVTRGAGSVGVAGAFALVQAARQIKSKTIGDFITQLRNAAQLIIQARPTAVTLGTAVHSCLKVAELSNDVKEVRTRLQAAANAVLDRDKEASRRIGQAGEKLVKSGSRVLTYCNTGPLAMEDDGTALAVIRFAHMAKKHPLVYVSETRPWLQGSRLTTWELQQEGISHKLIVDNACGFLFQKGLVDMVIVGADRIAANGDVANKIGTYENAILAQEHGIPFYVAAPLNAFDLSCASGNKISIEERSADEVRTVVGQYQSNQIGAVQVAPKSTPVLNPVFDITPAKYIGGIITDQGVLTQISTSTIHRLVGSTSNTPTNRK